MDEDTKKILNDIFNKTKSVKVISNTEMNVKMVGYVYLCNNCGMMNQKVINYKVLMETKELECIYCHKMCPIKPIPASIDGDKAIKLLRKEIRKLNKETIEKHN